MKRTREEVSFFLFFAFSTLFFVDFFNFNFYFVVVVVGFSFSVVRMLQGD